MDALALGAALLCVAPSVHAQPAPAGRFESSVALASASQADQIPGAPTPGQRPFGTPQTPQPPRPRRPGDKQDADKTPEGPPTLLPVATVWTTDLGAPPSAPPGFDADRGYVPLQSGQLVAVALDNGQTAWSVLAPTSVAPVADQGRVFVVGESELVALDARDGRALWRVVLAARAARPPVTRGGWVVVALESGEIAALRAQDGKTVWTVSTDSPATIDPVIEGDRLFATSARGLVALDLLSGRQLWERPLDGRATAAGRAHDVTYIGTANRWFYAVEERSGRVRWRWRVAGEPIGVVADDQVVVVLMLDHTIRAFKVGNGAQAWREALLYRPFAGPVRAPGQLLVAGYGASVRAYRPTDGTRNGEYGLPAPSGPDGAEQLDALGAVPHVRNGATIVDDLLVVVTQRGTLHGARRQLMPTLVSVGDLPGSAPTIPPPQLPDAFQPATTVTLPAQLPGTPLSVPAPPPVVRASSPF